ncbi:MAG: hypothetical protein Roseis2KO_44300 [Roseivirga sp.]
MATGTQLTIGFDGLSAFEFEPINYSLADGVHSFKIRVNPVPTGGFSLGSTSTKSGVTGEVLNFIAGGTLSFDLNNDGTFGGAGDEFTLVSMNVGGNRLDPGVTESVTIAPDGGSTGVVTITSTQTVLNSLVIDNPNNAVVSGTFSAADFNGIKSLEIEGVAVGGGFAPNPLVDNMIIIVGAVATNSAPTASDFTANPSEAITHTFATSDFGYSDGDSDALDHIKIASLPVAGTLYLDADHDDTYDSPGESVALNAEISKADLDAGNLQFLAAFPSSSFTFFVNDGTENSASANTVTLTVSPIPSVTLTQVNASLSESAVATTGSITANLSNTYGAAVVVTIAANGGTVGTDYTLSATTLTINPASSSATATLTVLDDNVVEGTESIIVEITNVSNGTESGSQSKTFTIANNDFLLDLTVLLEGPLSGVTMNQAINSLLPTDPTTVYSGILSETSSGIPATAVDWVEVELRTGTSSGTKVGTNRAAILKSDGSLVDKDGNTFTMSQADGSGYYVVIHHRNHLSVMSATAVSPANDMYTHDFTTAQSQNFNNGADGAKQIGAVFAMLAGDADGDGDVDATDLTTWRNQNGITFSYNSTNGDFNLDGVINAVDRNDFQQKNNSKASQVPTT